MSDDRREDREALREKTSREDRAKRVLKVQNCPICPPHKGENKGRWVKHGARKPRKKDRR